jgi:fibronectin type 3 domain-containing protein
MRKILVFVCIVGSLGACVNLDKPQNVAACVANNNCVNSSVDGGVTSADGKKDTSPFIEATDVAKPGSDVILPSNDVPPGNPEIDGGELPDLPMDDTPTGDDAGALSDVPVTSVDDSGDLPIVIGDARADGAKNDVPGDTRDANRDVAVGVCAPGGVIQPAGTPCRAAVGLCDVAETCDGVSADCPADKLAAAGKECRAIAGDCDIAETCSGTSPDCPADGFKQAGAVCRAAVPGGCDVAESCTGTSAVCPVDSLAPSTTVCRASTDGNKCDPAENCSGSSTTCPSNLIYTPPTVPGSVSAVAGTQQATISWAVATVATGYNVKRSTASGSGYTTLGSAPTTSASPYVDNGLAAGTYYYVVSSINTIATCESANSTEVSAKPTGPCTPPTAPTVIAAPGNGSVKLTWAAVSGAVSYSIARSQTTGTGYTSLGSPTPVNATTFTDSNVTNGVTYYYVVTASNGTCGSSNSNEASAAPACTPPAAITSLVATPGDSSVALTWTAPATAISYQILRSTTSGSSYTLAGSKGSTGFTDTNVVNGTTYYYVVTASNGSCSSGNSNEVSVTPACVPPAAPTGVTPTAGDGSISLSWTAPAGATLYRVSRNTTGTGTFPQIATPTATSYFDQPLTDGTTYYYVVAASNGSCWSANSAVASGTPVCTPPTMPGAITATPGDAQVSLSWGASPGATSYSVSRTTTSGATPSSIASPTVTSYTDSTGLANGNTYYYRVSASNGSCSSAYNAEVPATPVPACSQGAPGGVTANVTTSTQVKISWTASNPVPTGGYDIGRSTTSGGGFANVGHVGNTILTFTDSDTALLVGTTYYYVVTANGACTATSTAASIPLTCQTPAAPSAGLTATNSAGAITVSWTAVAGATAYTVYRSTSLGGSYTAISSNQTAATYTDPAAGLTNGTTYYYEVSASNANHQCASAQSAAVSVASCTIPVAPAGLSARRSGNRQVTLVWTNSTGAISYNILRSTTNGLGYAPVGTAAGSPYIDNTASNGTAYYYVVTARSDVGGNCSSGNSAQVSAPVCTVVTGSGTGSLQLQQQAAEWCIVTCDNNIGWWGDSNAGTRTLYVNNVQSANGAMPLPAQQNSGYAFYFTAGSAGNGDYAYWNYGSGTGRACP